MKRRARVDGELWWMTTPKGLSRDAIGAIQKRVTRLQRQQGLYCYSAWVFETRPQLHAHIVFLGNSWIAERLKRAVVCSGCEVAVVTDHDGLVRNYLVKERTPQANYGRTDLGGRLRGSHRIEGGGDRVRLSRELERDAIEAGLVSEWSHTNAIRASDRKPRRLQRLYPKKAPILSGQIALFPELEKPVARLHSFAHGYLPPAVAAEIEFRRKRLGMTQRELACYVGRTQGQLANALRGHDPLSEATVSRLRDVLISQMTIYNNFNNLSCTKHAGKFDGG